MRCLRLYDVECNLIGVISRSWCNGQVIEAACIGQRSSSSTPKEEIFCVRSLLLVTDHHYDGP